MSYGTAPYGVIAYGGTVSSPTTPVNLAPVVVFETPHVAVIPRWLPNSSPQQFLLYRHFANEVRGVNVWQCSDGTFRVDYPCNYEQAMTHPAAFFSDDPIGPDETPPGAGSIPATDFPALNNTNLAYPWNPFPGSTIEMEPGAYSTVYDIHEQRTEFTLNPYFTAWYQGGGIIGITQQQALVLTAAGFGDCIT